MWQGSPVRAERLTDILGVADNAIPMPVFLFFFVLIGRMYATDNDRPPVIFLHVAGPCRALKLSVGISFLTRPFLASLNLIVFVFVEFAI